MATERGTWAVYKKVGVYWIRDGSIYRPNEDMQLPKTSTQVRMQLADGSKAFVTPSTLYLNQQLTMIWKYDTGTMKSKIETYITNQNDIKILDHLGTEYIGRFISVESGLYVGTEPDTFDVKAMFERMADISASSSSSSLSSSSSSSSSTSVSSSSSSSSSSSTSSSSSSSSSSSLSSSSSSSSSLSSSSSSSNSYSISSSTCSTSSISCASGFDMWSVLCTQGAYYKLDEDAVNTDVVDSYHGHNGTASQNTDQFHVAGKVGTGAFDFDAVGENVEIPWHEDIGAFNKTSFGVCAWIYARSGGVDGGQYGRIMDNMAENLSGSSTGGWRMRLRNVVDGKARLGGHLRCIGGGRSYRWTNDYVVNLNEWQHVAYTWNEDSDGKTKLYVNGHQFAQDPTGEDSANPGKDDRHHNIFIGLTNDPSGGSELNTFDGYIDDCRVFKQAISATAIRAICNNGTGTEADGGCFSWSSSSSSSSSSFSSSSSSSSTS